jgi:hypothetical protein
LFIFAALGAGISAAESMTIEWSMKQLQGSFPIYAPSIELDFNEASSIISAPRCAGEEALFHV